MTEQDVIIQDLRQEVEKLKAELDTANSLKNYWRTNANLLDEERKQLRTENAALKAKIHDIKTALEGLPND